MTIVMGMVGIILSFIKNIIYSFLSPSQDEFFKYKLTKIQGNEFIIYHHLGLGDVVICNGLINFVSKNYNKIFLIVDINLLNQIEYLYSLNKKIQVIPVNLREVNNAEEEVKKISNKLKLEVLKVGFSYIPGMRFYKSFYKQLNLKYKISYSLFSQPRNQDKENELYNHLLDYYKIEDEKYNLVHSEASNKSFDLNIKNDYQTIYVNKESDIFGNMFFYNKVIENASEIHCVNSSFCHYVDRSKYEGPLYYHHVRGSKLELIKDWKVVNYGS